MGHKIGWCDETENPGVGCTKCSPGCQRCYALPMAVRLAHNPELPAETRAAYRAAITKDERPSLLGAPPAWRWSGTFVAIPGAIQRFAGRLERWRKPRVIFVESMGDLFHESNRIRLLDQLLCLATFFPWHVLVFLTKRVKRMADYFMYCDARGWSDRVEDAAHELWGGTPDGWTFEWPLPNLWLMATVEDQERAEERIPILLEIPAALHGVSVEPMLGGVDVGPYMWPTHWRWDAKFRTPQEALAAGAYAEKRRQALVPAGNNYLGWVIAGGETGPGARAMKEEWALSLRDQCAGAGVPFWFKGWGGRQRGEELDGRLHHERPKMPGARR